MGVLKLRKIHSRPVGASSARPPRVQNNRVVLSASEGFHMAVRKPYGILRCAQNDNRF